MTKKENGLGLFSGRYFLHHEFYTLDLAYAKSCTQRLG